MFFCSLKWSPWLRLIGPQWYYIKGADVRVLPLPKDILCFYYNILHSTAFLLLHYTGQILGYTFELYLYSTRHRSAFTEPHKNQWDLWYSRQNRTWAYNLTKTQQKLTFFQIQQHILSLNCKGTAWKTWERANFCKRKVYKRSKREECGFRWTMLKYMEVIISKNIRLNLHGAGGVQLEMLVIG